jgi:hypothetical protein
VLYSQRDRGQVKNSAKRSMRQSKVYPPTVSRVNDQTWKEARSPTGKADYRG